MHLFECGRPLHDQLRPLSSDKHFERYHAFEFPCLRVAVSVQAGFTYRSAFELSDRHGLHYIARYPLWTRTVMRQCLGESTEPAEVSIAAMAHRARAALPRHQAVQFEVALIDRKVGAASATASLFMTLSQVASRGGDLDLRKWEHWFDSSTSEPAGFVPTSEVTALLAVLANAENALEG